MWFYQTQSKSNSKNNFQIYRIYLDFAVTVSILVVFNLIHLIQREINIKYFKSFIFFGLIDSLGFLFHI